MNICSLCNRRYDTDAAYRIHRNSAPLVGTYCAPDRPELVKLQDDQGEYFSLRPADMPIWPYQP